MIKYFDLFEEVAIKKEIVFLVISVLTLYIVLTVLIIQTILTVYTVNIV